MHDFDKARRRRHAEREAALGDRGFTFGGHTLHYRANAPYTVIQSVAALTEGAEGSVVIDTLVNATINLIEPDDRDLFHRACADEAYPVTYDDLMELANWLIERQAERPPTPPVSSASISETTGTTSTGTSSIEREEVSRT